MGFPARIIELETGNNLFPQWCPLRNRKQKQKQLRGLVALRCRQRPKFCGVNRKKIFFHVVVHGRSCFLEFGSNFPGFHGFKKRVFRRRSVGDWTKLCFGSQIFDKCMWRVCHDVCGVCGEDWQVCHSEDKSNSRFKLILYLSSFSSLSSALSIPNSNCSSATCG